MLERELLIRILADKIKTTEMTHSRERISGYYDGFSEHLKQVGVNIRHRTIYYNLRKNGLKSNHRVLEIGCGIGQVTGLIAKFLTNGTIRAVDISPTNIENAKRRLRIFSNITFTVSDMADFESDETYDLVVLPDVLEHIPVEQHMNLFAVIAAHTHQGSIVFINIPSPHFQDYLSKNKPELQQIVDLALYGDILFPAIFQNGFVIHSLFNYGLAVEQLDYQQIILKKKQGLEKVRYYSKMELMKLELISRLRMIII